MIRTQTCVALAASLALLVPFAVAQFTSTYSPPFHGQPCTEFSGWESFSNPDTLANAADDPLTSSSDSWLLQLTPGAIITAAGNIDHLTQAPAFRITDSVTGDLLEVVLQVSIQLNPYDWSTAVLRYVDGLGTPHVIAPSSSVFLVHQMGHDERLITWDLSSNTDIISSYALEFSATNSFSTLDAVKLDTRFECTPANAYCFGDGGGCPCGLGLSGNGCPSSIAAGGAHLAAVGMASIASDTLVLQGSVLPNGPGLYFQGSNASDIPFGDGKLCTNSAIFRLGVAFASGNASAYPGGPGSSPIHLGGATAAGNQRQYQLWYRDADPTFCTSFTFNLTNAVSVTWTP